MSQPTSFIACIWTTDPRGACTSAVDQGDPTLPPLAAGTLLTDWLRGADPADGRGVALLVADALARQAPFHHEVEVRDGAGGARRIVAAGRGIVRLR